MTALRWHEMHEGELSAYTDDVVYLITWDQHAVVLTRFASAIPVRAAAEAALNAIRLGGIYAGSPEFEAARAATVRHFKQLAQAYESGIDAESYPAWRHGYRSSARH